MSDGKTGLQLRSLLKKSGELEISLASVPTPEPAEDEVVVRVEGTPINPSDLGLLIGPADMSTAIVSGTKDQPVVTAKMPEAAIRTMGARLDQSLPVGNEGAGVVIPDGQDGLDDRRRHVQPIPHHEGEGRDGTARRHHRGRRRLMVRQSADCAWHDRDHAARKSQGAGAYGTIAFDAIGGGKLAGQILTGMERAANKTAKEYSRYGSSVHKQVYIYGGLDTRPTELTRAFGMMWGVSGWLLTPFLQKIGPAEIGRLRQRVASELKTTFASHYTRVVSLQEVLQLANIAAYNKRATGEKFLINPGKV